MVDRLSYAHLLQIVRKLLRAIEANHIGFAAGDAGLAKRCERAGQVVVSTAKYDIHNRVDQGDDLLTFGTEQYARARPPRSNLRRRQTSSPGIRLGSLTGEHQRSAGK